MANVRPTSSPNALQVTNSIRSHSVASDGIHSPARPDTSTDGTVSVTRLHAVPRTLEALMAPSVPRTTQAPVNALPAQNFATASASPVLGAILSVTAGKALLRRASATRRRNPFARALSRSSKTNVSTKRILTVPMASSPLLAWNASLKAPTAPVTQSLSMTSASPKCTSPNVLPASSRRATLASASPLSAVLPEPPGAANTVSTAMFSLAARTVSFYWATSVSLVPLLSVLKTRCRKGSTVSLSEAQPARSPTTSFRLRDALVSTATDHHVSLLST